MTNFDIAVQYGVEQLTGMMGSMVKDGGLFVLPMYQGATNGEAKVIGKKILKKVSGWTVQSADKTAVNFLKDS